MPVHWCTSCANQIKYEVVKPSACPKCKKGIGSSTKATYIPVLEVVKPSKSIQAKEIDSEEEDDDTVDTQPVRRRTRASKMMTPRSAMTPIKPIVASTNEDDENEDNDEGDDEYDSSSYSPRKMQQMKAQFLQNLGEGVSVKNVVDADDRPVKFGDLFPRNLS